MTRHEHLTCADFERQLRLLSTSIEQRDPNRIDFSLRVGIAQSLFLFHDELRCREEPFDRSAFATRLEQAVTAVDRSESSNRSTQNPSSRPPYEEYVADLYSRCWSKYDDGAFVDTMTFFGERFHLNGVSLDRLQDGECLDAGCGSGRYAMAMVQSGARRSVGIDISELAISEARARAARLGYEGSTEFLRGSVTGLPMDWSSRFDFVCSNGVVHHTPQPVEALNELFRVLKPGGEAFIMVYGSGGLFWALVDFIRHVLDPVPLDFSDAWLEMTGVSVGKLFFCLDHWYTPYQERVTRDELEKRLEEIGFVDLQYLPRARIYDSSERLHRYPGESDLIGSPDPRYLVRKPE